MPVSFVNHRHVNVAHKVIVDLNAFRAQAAEREVTFADDDQLIAAATASLVLLAAEAIGAQTWVVGTVIAGAVT